MVRWECRILQDGGVTFVLPVSYGGPPRVGSDCTEVAGKTPPGGRRFYLNGDGMARDLRFLSRSGSSRWELQQCEPNIVDYGLC